MKNGWTGGQYSLYRFFFGLYLFVHFFQLFPWGKELFSNQGMVSSGDLSPLFSIFPNVLAFSDAPFVVATLSLFAMVASLCFMGGKWDRISAFFLWYVLACFFGRNPLIANPSLPFVGWLLLAHLFLPKAPYGSLAAKKRVDPRGGWQMTPSVYLASWIVMSLAYTYSGVLKLMSPSWVDGTAFSYLLENPLARCNFLRDTLLKAPSFILKIMSWTVLASEISFAPLALIKRCRPWIWSFMLCMHVGLLFLINFADLTLGMIMIHLFTFDPSWIKPRPVEGRLKVFYDGTCGFCHMFVRFVLAENREKAPFLFSPLEKKFSKEEMPNSIVVEDEGQVLFKSRAVFRVLVSLGGVWKILGLVLSMIPLKVADFFYDRIAQIRHRLFKKPKEGCPLISQGLREFFEV